MRSQEIVGKILLAGIVRGKVVMIYISLSVSELIRALIVSIPKMSGNGLLKALFRCGKGGVYCAYHGI